MTDIVFHIGLHKTATTTLQTQFFPACRDLNYLDGEQVDEFVRRVSIADPCYVSGTELRAKLQKYLDPARCNLLSREAFSGPLYAGVGKRGLDHRTPIIMNLKSAFPEARLLLVIRRQDALAKSVYRQYLKFGGTEPASRFFANGEDEGIFPRDRLRFAPYLRMLSEMFDGRVMFLVYEELVRAPEVFLRKLCRFLGIEEPQVPLGQANSTTLGPRGMEVTRVANRFFRNQLNPGGLMPGIPRFRNGAWEFVNPVRIMHDRWPGRGGGGTNPAIYEHLLNECRTDNQEVDNQFHLDLKRYGYY